MSTFWSIFIIVLVVANVGACLWLIRWTMHMKPGSGDDATEHVWDVDLKEANNPLPKWWLNTFYLSIIFSIIYLVLYPGLGNFQGVLNWSQFEQYDAEVAASEQKYASVYAAFSDQDIEQLAGSPDALNIGRNVYLNNCASCHGSDGRGATGFPNLTDSEWMYGSDAAAIEQTIRNGRMGNMPALGALVSDAEIDKIIAFLRSNDDAASPDISAGRQLYMTSGCIGCHGATGEGNPLLGAPNLRNDIWLHGGTRDALLDVIKNGRVNRMPAHQELLSDDRIRLVTAYVLSLNKE
jgi:cytochrome c oxidase cbb3-type subunit 3